MGGWIRVSDVPDSAGTTRPQGPASHGIGSCFGLVRMVLDPRSSAWEYNFGMPLSANIENLPRGIAVVKLSGSLTLGTSLKVVDTQIHSAIQGGVSKMVMDLTDVEYVDSAGLGMLMYAYGMLNEKKGALRLCGVSERVMSLLEMTKTTTFLPIDQSLAESVAELQG